MEVRNGHTFCPPRGRAVAAGVSAEASRGLSHPPRPGGRSLVQLRWNPDGSREGHAERKSQCPPDAPCPPPCALPPVAESKALLMSKRTRWDWGGKGWDTVVSRVNKDYS